jgi:S-DNA-T family DNA segregation ATPase FtsK/SpoIIIE
MRVTLTLTDAAGTATDIAVAADRAVTLGELRGLLPSPWAEAGSTAIISGNTVLADHAVVGGPGLRSGSELCVGAAGHRVARTSSSLVLRVTSGPDCGLVLPLGRGLHVIGRAPDVDVSLADPDLSRRHLELTVGLRSITVRDLGSTNGSFLDSAPLSSVTHPLPVGSSISIGATRITLTDIAEPPAVTRADADGTILVHRPPRFLARAATGTITLPSPGTPVPRPRVQWLAALLPMLICAGLAVAMRSVQFLAFAVLSPVTLLAGAVTDRRSWRRGRRAAEVEHAAAVHRADLAVAEALDAERAHLQRALPDAASVFQTAAVPDCRLWERQRGGQSFLELRLGLAELPSLTTVRELGEVRAAGSLPAAPATARLDSTVLGVAGPGPHSVGVVRWLLAQLLVLHSPADVKLVVLSNEERSADWRWLRWAAAGLHTVALTAQRRADAAQELLDLVRQRSAGSPAASRPWTGNWLVLVIDPASTVTEVPALAEVLSEGPSVGVTGICVATDHRTLPSCCGLVARFVSQHGTALTLTCHGRPTIEVAAEMVSDAWATRLARTLAPLRDAGDEIAAIPRQLRLTELLEPAATDGDAPPGSDNQGCSSPIGAGADGPFDLDLTRDGPHVLIAGTTGSGKSELLRTIVTGLAVRHQPDEVAFVLVDYKGGAAFSDCGRFPHVLGLVTDLDAHLTRRALISLDAELKRREEAFRRAGVADLARYRTTGHQQAGPLGRLVIIIDEFASLAEELPDFLQGLLGVAQRGRSLGVHLILATQRPAGVLSQDIKANMSLRIALRVTDPAESIDVIADDAASRISRRLPGRAIARRTDGDLIAFQAAQVGLPAVARNSVRVVGVDGWNNPLACRPSEGAGTDLEEIGDRLRRAARRSTLPSAPWLPPLPRTLTVPRTADEHEVAFALADDPARQRQPLVCHRLLEGGSLGFVGGPRSGRTTALRSIVAAAVRANGPDELHLYAIDCSGGGWSAVRELPHCGAVVDAGHPTGISRLLVRLQGELEHRRRMMAEVGAASLPEAAALGLPLAPVLVVLDGWERFTALVDELDGGRSADLLVQLMRDGAAAGTTFLLAGDRAMLGLRIGSSIGRKVLLRMTDRADYAMGGISADAVPADIGPGRGFLVEDGLELQVATLTDGGTASAEWVALLAQATVSASVRNPPGIRIRSLPPRVAASELRAGADPGPTGCLLGIGGDEAYPVCRDLFDRDSRFLIAGPSRCGKTDAALSIATQAHAKGIRTVVAATHRSALADWARSVGGPVISPTDSAADLDTDLLVVDDVEQFAECAAGERILSWVTAYLGAVVVTGRSDDLHVSFRGIGVEVRRHRTGVLLQPSPVDGELLGVRLTSPVTAALPGRGVLVDDRTRADPVGYLPIQLGHYR